MIYLACLEAVVLFAVTFSFLRYSAALEEAWMAERRELLNRIQRPEHIPVASQPDFEIPEREPDEWAQVGQIVIDDKYGLDDN